MTPCKHNPPQSETCRLCWLFVNNPTYHRLWSDERCRHLGALIATEPCNTCAGRVELKVFACNHPEHTKTTIPQCHHCTDYES